MNPTCVLEGVRFAQVLEQRRRRALPRRGSEDVELVVDRLVDENVGVLRQGDEVVAAAVVAAEHDRALLGVEAEREGGEHRPCGTRIAVTLTRLSS